MPWWNNCHGGKGNITMNNINTFGQAIIHLGGTNVLAHIIAVNHEMRCGAFIYSNVKDAQQAAYSLCISLEKYAPLKFNPDFDFSDFCGGILGIYTSDSKGLFSKLSNHQIYKR